MKKIYQKIDDPVLGDCFKCSIASILDLKYNDVPNFNEFGDDWWVKTTEFFKEHGYVIGEKMFYNPNVIYLENPTLNCFEEKHIDKSYILDNITEDDGINGLFLAAVYYNINIYSYKYIEKYSFLFL